MSFGHQGALYRKSFVMYDRQSESMWVHVSGQAIKGPRKGQQLEFIASEVMQWKDWQARHPLTTVLIGEKASGFMGTFQLDQKTDDFGLSVGQGREVVLLPLKLMKQVPIVPLRVSGEKLVAVFDSHANRATAFSREVDGKVLDFNAVLPLVGDGGSKVDLKKPQLMRDSQTGSTWQRLTGHCLAGPMRGRALQAVPATLWLNHRWRGFFPKGRVIELPESER